MSLSKDSPSIFPVDSLNHQNDVGVPSICVTFVALIADVVLKSTRYICSPGLALIVVDEIVRPVAPFVPVQS